jgi:uncharacterized membrane protein YgdD (TMEM256/DUF423 family)
MRFDRGRWGVAAGVSGFVGVVMGAVGAHAVADPYVAKLVETASLYELIHAAVLLWLCDAPGRYALAARWLFLIGTLLFCGTLYLKGLMGWEAVVRLAPFGGVSFMLGWLLIALQAWTSRGRTDIRP